LIAQGSAFLPGYSIDDCRHLVDERAWNDIVGRGRFGSAAFTRVAHLLGLHRQHANVVFVSLAIAGNAFFGALVVRFWGWGRSGWLSAAAAAMVATHPFVAEIFTFRLALAVFMAALLLLSLLLIPRWWSAGRLVAGSALFAIALSLYQTVLGYAYVAGFLGLAVWLSRLLRAGCRSQWDRRIRRLLSPRRIGRQRPVALLACATFGTFLYLLVHRAVVSLFGIELPSRARFMGREQLASRAAEVADTLRFRLLEPDPLLDGFAKGLLLALLLVAVLGVLRHVRRRGASAWAVAGSVIMLLAAAIVSTVGVIAVLEEFWPAPRVMAPSGVFWAGCVVLASGSWGRRVRRLVVALSTLAVLAFLGASNRILAEQHRLNARDSSKANRIVARIEALPEFSRVTSVAVHGKPWRYPLAYRTADHDMNISAFGADWAQVPLLAEVSGYAFVAADPAAQEMAAAYCREVEPWPGPQSIAIRAEVAIVCLAK
jgi:hypothetical protein